MSEHRPYEIIIARSAVKELVDLPARVNAEAETALDRLTAHLNEGAPPPDITAMRGDPDEYRIRIGDYRFVYVKDDAVRTITVFRVAHRRDVFGRR